MARKNLLAGLTAPKLPVGNSDDAVPPPPIRQPLAFTGRGALGAVTRSIEDLASRANAAKDLEARLTAGQVVVELDPALIDPSFVTDRMSQDDVEYQALRDSIAASGQDSPILVRPHADRQGRYQVAFGHRRLRAAKELAKPVRAIVRHLSDRELVLAQGQENSARANLSFIERARFAHRLEESGYDRETIMQALSIDKTGLSRLISVVTRIPGEVIDSIGSAPATGRDRWVELATLFREQPKPERLAMLLDSAIYQAAGADDRFQKVLASFSAPASGPSVAPVAGEVDRDRKSAEYWYHSSGRRVLKVAASDRGLVLSIDNRALPGFGDYLLAEMESLVSNYLGSIEADGRERGRGVTSAAD